MSPFSETGLQWRKRPNWKRDHGGEPPASFSNSGLPSLLAAPRRAFPAKPGLAGDLLLCSAPLCTSVLVRMTREEGLLNQIHLLFLPLSHKGILSCNFSDNPRRAPFPI